MPRYSPHAAPALADRVLLAVPYDEKDEAKAHGARWDPGIRLWWIERRNIALFPGIYRWIVDDPGLRAKAKAAHKFMRRGAVRSARKAHKQDIRTPVTTPQTTFLLPSCTCPVAPWENCEHTAAAPVVT